MELKRITIKFLKNATITLSILTISQTIQAQNTDETVYCTFDTPRDSPMPVVNYHSYNKDQNGSITVIGENGPDLTHIRKLDLQYNNMSGEITTFLLQEWSADKGLGGNGAFHYLDPDHTFDEINPEIILLNTGIENFDGSYYVTVTNMTEATSNNFDFVMVSKTGEFSIYYSFFDDAPDCVNNFNDDNNTLSIFDNQIDNGVVLKQNYPNPFKNTTTIEYNLSEKSNINLEIYNMQGQLVKSLDKGIQSSGNHTLTFDLNNRNNGVYISVLVTDKGSQNQLIVLEN